MLDVGDEALSTTDGGGPFERDVADCEMRMASPRNKGLSQV